jgi:acyl-coenzyme A thioesterase PaaI-like protein
MVRRGAAGTLCDGASQLLWRLYHSDLQRLVIARSLLRKQLMDQSLQEQYAPLSICFGCGPSNAKGLRIRSFPDENIVVCEWRAEPHHEAFPGMIAGGIVGTLLDCHSNWTAAWHLMNQAGRDEPDCTVTADYAVKLLRPTPSNATIFLSAKVIESSTDRAIVEATLTAEEKIRATCRGTFVVVKPGHPAYHRWGQHASQ